MNTDKLMQNSHEKLSDSELYKLAQEYGLRAKQWLRKFEGLLPEIYRRCLYKRRGFASIQEFGAKLAGMSHEKVEKILRLANRLEDKPMLKSLLETGEASYSKIEKVAYIATPETEAIWAEKVLNIPQPALELYVQEVRKNNNEQAASMMLRHQSEQAASRLKFTPQSNSQPEEITSTAIYRTGGPETRASFEDEASILSIKVSAELEYELRLLKQKLEKERGETLGFAEVLQELLKVYKSQTSAGNSSRLPSSAKTVIQLCPHCIKEKANEMAEWAEVKRTIPMEVQYLVRARQQNRCAFPNCTKPPEIFHHTRRFALNRNHDPDYIVHLCALHERLAHAGLIENEEKKSTEWSMKSILHVGDTSSLTAKFRIDEKVNAFRREPTLGKC